MARFGSQLYAPGMGAIVNGIGGNIDYLEDLYIYGDNTNGTGLMQKENRASVLTRVVIGKFDRNIGVDSGGRISGNDVVVFGANDIGVNLFFGSLNIAGFGSLGNLNHGVQSANNGFCGVSGSVVAGNGGNGLTVVDNGYAEVTSAVFRKSGVANGGYGIRASGRSTVKATGITANGNGGGADFSAVEGSYINATSYVNASTFDPTANTVGNANSYIKA